MKLEYIEWSDSVGCGADWTTLEDLKEMQESVCRSVGWVVADTANHIVIVPHIHDGQSYGEALYSPKQGCGEMTIPKKSIQRREKLSEYKTADLSDFSTLDA